MKKIIIGIVALCVIGAIVFFIWGGETKTHYQLQTSKVAKGDITTVVTATGTVEPITLVEVGTQVSGVISKIYVDYNSVVEAGQVIAELDRGVLESEVSSAEASLKSKQVALKQQELSYNRNKELWARKAISKVDWEDAETNYETAQLAVKSSEATLFKAKTNLGYATIYSTIDGVVVSRAVEEGQTVAASFSTPTLFTIANDLTKMRVIANVDEADIGQVKEGQRVTFTVDTYPDDTFSGEVVQVRLEATTTSNVVTYEVVVNAPNPDLKLKPGLTANITIYTLEESNVLTVPLKALRFEPTEELSTQIPGLTIEQPGKASNGEKMVWVEENNALQPKVITVGVNDGINSIVKSGLKEGDKVVTGSVEVKDKNAAQATDSSSPFMPKPPGKK